jgi:hypothetical protein
MLLPNGSAPPCWLRNAASMVSRSVAIVADAVSDPHSVFGDDEYAQYDETVWAALDQFGASVMPVRGVGSVPFVQEARDAFSSLEASTVSAQQMAGKQKKDKEDAIAKAAVRYIVTFSSHCAVLMRVVWFPADECN